MSSPLRIYYSQPSPSPAEEVERPAVTSFARTLRSFAEKQKFDLSSSPLPFPVAEPKIKRSRPVGTPLTAGPSSSKPEALKADPAPEPVEVAEEKPKQPQPLGAGLLSRAWTWLQKSNKFSSTKQLRVSETVSLGEKRFVALVDIEGQKFLIGGGASGVSLLTQLSAADATAHALQAVAEAAGQSK
jgi:hypothetical protein